MLVSYTTDDGTRPYIVLSVGPKWATLFQAARLETIKAPRRDFDKYSIERDAFSVRMLRRIIRNRVREANKFGFRYSAEAVDQALNKLEEGRL
jgi:hypothetical protein